MSTKFGAKRLAGGRWSLGVGSFLMRTYLRDAARLQGFDHGADRDRQDRRSPVLCRAHKVLAGDARAGDSAHSRVRPSRLALTPVFALAPVRRRPHSCPELPDSAVHGYAETRERCSNFFMHDVPGEVRIMLGRHLNIAVPWHLYDESKRTQDTPCASRAGAAPVQLICI